MKALMLGMAMLATSCAASAQGYLGIAIGQANIKNVCQGAASSISCDGKDHAWKIFGGYQFTRSFAVELGLGELGTAEARSSGDALETAALTAVELSAIGSLPIGNRLAVHGRLGIYWGDMVAGPGIPTPALGPPFVPPPRRNFRSGDNQGATFGLGASYAFIEQAVLRLEWQRYPKLGGEPKLDVDVVSIGVLARF